MRFHINHVWTNAPVVTHVSDPQQKVAASRSNFCLIPPFHLGERRDTLRGDGSPSQWGRTAMVAGGTEGAKLWTTCFHHLGHILHDGAKHRRLDSHDNARRARLDANERFWQERWLKLASPALPLLLSSLCPYVNKLFQTNRVATDRDWGFNEKKTEAEMKHWLPIQIAVITTSTLKLCNNLCSIALLRWGK